MEMKGKSVKEGVWNDCYLNTNIGKKWKWQNCKIMKNHLVTAKVSLSCLKEKLFVWLSVKTWQYYLSFYILGWNVLIVKIFTS